MSKLAILGGQAVRTEPFPSWPVFDETEEQALLEVLHSGKWWQFAYGQGAELREPEPGQPRSKVAEFQEAFAHLQQARYGIACANGTAAIEISLKALGVGPGDEVIVPAYTFVATATAPLQVNAVPIFVDIELDTLNIDPRRVEEAVTPATKAIIPVHFGGLACNMDALLEIAERHNLLIIEDAAHGHGGTWRNRGLGSIGNAGTFSFQASKNMTSGEGGLITTNDHDVAALCESYLWAGREAGRPWYEHYRLGWNYRLTEFQAAILLQQIKRVEAQNATRRENASYLSRRLAEVPGLYPLRIPEHVTKPTYHLFAFRLDELGFGVSRKNFLEALMAEGIPCFGGYSHPLYKNPMFLNRDFYPHGCPLTCGHYAKPIDYASFADRCQNSERACREMAWIEHRLLLARQSDMDDIVTAISKIYEHRVELSEVAQKTGL
jgi:dTDP-4-amino-4,6-dideoxygalactose transaminase